MLYFVPFSMRDKQPNGLGMGVLLGHFHHSAKNPWDSPDYAIGVLSRDPMEQVDCYRTCFILSTCIFELSKFDTMSLQT